MHGVPSLEDGSSAAECCCTGKGVTKAVVGWKLWMFPWGKQCGQVVGMLSLPERSTKHNNIGGCCAMNNHDWKYEVIVYEQHKVTSFSSSAHRVSWT